MDKFPQLQQTMMQFAALVVTPTQGPGMQLLGMKMLNSFWKLVDMFMVEFDIPNKDILNPPLVEEAQVYAQIQQQFTQMVQQIQMLQQQLTQLQGAAPAGQAEAGMAPQAPSGPSAQGSPPMA
jgi:hypothetical protein